jgi:hypothetical protein
MDSGPDAQSRGRSVLTFSRRRVAMLRSSETIGTIAAAFAKTPSTAGQSRKIAGWDNPD